MDHASFKRSCCCYAYRGGLFCQRPGIFCSRRAKHRLFLCREVPSGSTVNPSAGTVTFPNGSTVATTHITCSQTSVVWCSSSCTGHVAQGDLTISGSGNLYTNYQDEWTTPPVPSSGTFSSPEGVGLYDALQTSSDIIQPLLVYGCITSTDCSNSWRFTAYADMGGSVYYTSPALSPSASSTLEGSITQYDFETCSGGSGTGAGYQAVAQIVSGSSESLNVCTNDKYTDAVTGSLEVQDLSSCSQMPGTTSDSFTSLSWTTTGSSTASESSGSQISFCSGTPSWVNSPSIYLELSWTD
jgi:hypothetical protein